jgi:hypothetical protein
MKIFLTSLCIALGAAFTAHAQDLNPIATLSYTGAAQVTDVVLTGEKRHTVYETITVEKTCSREVYDGTETRCETHYERSCRTQRLCPNRPGTLCRDETVCDSRPVQNCYNHTRYRTEYYTCYERETVPVGTERDYLVDASIRVTMEAARINGNEQIILQITDGAVSISSGQTSGKLLLFKDANLTEQLNNGVKTIRGEVKISALSAEDVLNPVKNGILGLKADGTTLKITTQKIEIAQLLGIQLKIKRSRLLADKTIHEGLVPHSAIEVIPSGSKSEVQVNLAKIPMEEALKDSKYKIEVTLVVQRDPRLLNPRLIGQASSATQKLEIKLK